MIKTSVRDVLEALNTITGGRLLNEMGDTAGYPNPFVILRTSRIPGKEVTEMPGLVFGDPDRLIEKIAVVMTLTESVVELASALNIDALVVHHPVADAASCGGVTLRDYLGLYNLAVFEIHEAFHGLHPGIAFLHGHLPISTDTCFGGVTGKVVMIGKPLRDVRCLQDILKKLEVFMGRAADIRLLEEERKIYQDPALREVSAIEGASLLLGHPANVPGLILHCFPHTGFSVSDLESALDKYPDVRTVIASISRLRNGHPLICACRDRGLNLINGNSHALEIWENGLPLAYALASILTGVEVSIFRERVTAYPLSVAGTGELRQYARRIAGSYLSGGF